MGIQINDFLNAFSKEAKFCLSLPVFWSVSIDGVSTGSINSVLQSAQEKWRATTSPEEMTRNGNILVAQDVGLPDEQAVFGIASMNNAGGFLPSYVMNNRNDFLSRQLSVNILETNEDLEQNYFRPWMIAVGIKGLVENGPNLKGTMVIKQYDNQGNLRKGFKFNKVFPKSVEGYTLNYQNTDFKVKSVTFACQNYEKL
jgi:hypothetical protein